MTYWDHWIAFTLLGILGLHMIYAGLKPESEAYVIGATERRHGFWGLAATGLATSIDAMVVGVGLTTMVMVTLGIMLGRVPGNLAGKRAKIFGGFTLIAIGATIFVRAPISLGPSPLWGARMTVMH